MIVTIINDGAGVGQALAENLALLRVRSGQRVLLLDTAADQPVSKWSRQRAAAGMEPRLPTVPCVLDLSQVVERQLPRYHDLVIDAEPDDPCHARAALIMANTVVVPLAVDVADPHRQDNLIRRLNTARMFNPAAQVLFVPVHAGPLTQQQSARCRAYVGQVLAARSATLVIEHAAALVAAHERGRCAGELPGDGAAAREIRALYDDVFQHPVVSTH